jgi:Fe-S-cluster-containing hydrogenase component 2
MRMFVDRKKCTACRMCQLVCSVTRFGEFNVHRANCHVEDSEFIPKYATFCVQCKEPKCEEVCVAKAFEKTAVDGVLTINRDKCTKCGNCVEACAINAIHIDKTDGYPLKCDLCITGEAKCVAQCPFQVLEVK